MSQDLLRVSGYSQERQKDGYLEEEKTIGMLVTRSIWV